MQYTEKFHFDTMKDNSPTTSVEATKPNRGNRWNPVLPFLVTLLGSVTFIFDAGTTFLGSISTFGLCFFIAYITQIVFRRFFVALPLFMTVQTYNHDSLKPQPERGA